jgi:hypothetical protein
MVIIGGLILMAVSSFGIYVPADFSFNGQNVFSFRTLPKLEYDASTVHIWLKKKK